MVWIFSKNLFNYSIKYCREKNTPQTDLLSSRNKNTKTSKNITTDCRSIAERCCKVPRDLQTFQGFYSTDSIINIYYLVEQTVVKFKIKHTNKKGLFKIHTYY